MIWKPSRVRLIFNDNNMVQCRVRYTIPHKTDRDASSLAVTRRELSGTFMVVRDATIVVVKLSSGIANVNYRCNTQPIKPCLYKL